MRNLSRLCLLTVVFLLPLVARAQTLTINNDVQTVATLTNTVATLTGRAKLRVTGTGDPIPGCTIHLNSPDAWFVMTNIAPSQLVSTFLSRVRVNGANAVHDSNVRVVQFGQGAVVIPHAPDFSPLEVFDGDYFTGRSKQIRSYVSYNDVSLGALKLAISSFKLKHGYMATFAQQENGSGASRVYIAQDGDLEVGLLPSALDNNIRFVRVFPWRWTSKKGSCDVDPVALKANWHYNWNISLNSGIDWEYAAIRQQPYRPGLDQDWKTRGVNHLSGFNEPDNPVEDAYQNLTPPGSVSDAVARWPDLLATGLRVGAPAVTDGGYNWIVDFINQANAAGRRVDYVPVHYYRSTSGNNPATAASNLYNFLKSIYDVAQRPLWVTEFNNGANWTDNAHDPNVTQNRDVIEAMIEMMDSTPWIERYAVYSNVEWFRDTHYTDGSLTPMGTMYRDHVAPLSYLQEMADAGTGNSARYAFDGDAHDGWGNGQDGMLVGAPTFTAGKYGQAIVLDGATDYVQLSPRIADTTDFTFAAWVWWNGGGNWQRIFDFGSGTSNYLALTAKAGSSGGLRFLMRDGGGEQQLNTATLATGAWVHVAVTIVGDTGKLFVNGVLVNTNTAMTINPVDVGTKFNYLGKSQTAADPLFNGRLDDVRIVSSALSDAQIAAMVATAPPQFSSPTLVKANAMKLQPYTGAISADATGGSGARTFSKMSGPAWLAVAANGSMTGVPGVNDGGTNRFFVRVTDAAGAINTATLQVTVDEAPGLISRHAFDGNANASVSVANGVTSGAPLYATGRIGSAIDLDGTDDFVTLPPEVASTPDFTIAMWLNWDGGGNWQRIFDFGNGTGEYLFLTPKSATNTLRFEIKNNGAAQVLETTVLPTAQWVHVAVTLGANTGRLYVNGVLRDTETITLKPTDFAPVVNYLGKSQWPDPLYNGRIDEFLIFNQALTGSQIVALVNGRAPTFTTDPVSKPAASAGVAYNQSLIWNAADPDAASTLTYSKVGGPAWLTVSPDGRISGVPAAGDAGVNRFIVRVTDPTLLADDATLNIVVPASSGLTAHFQLDGNLSDAAGGASGTATGGPVYEAGIFDKALGFDGADDFAALPAGLVSTLTDATFAMRVRWDGGAAWQRIFDFGNNTSQYMVVSPSSGNGTLQFAIATTGATNVQRLEAPAPLPVGEWTHVAVTLIGNTGAIYVNGAAVASTSITLDPASVAPTLNYLGKSQFAADPTFNGALDDFRIYNRGLSAAEIAALAIPPTPTIVPPDNTFTGWAATVAFTGGQNGALANPDQDGLVNVFEYLFGANPLIATSGALPAAQTRTGAALGVGGDPAKTYLTLQARVRKLRPGITLTPEAAATIAGLAEPDAALHALQAGAPVSDGDYEIFTYYYDVPLEELPARTAFIRLRTTVN